MGGSSHGRSAENPEKLSELGTEEREGITASLGVPALGYEKPDDEEGFQEFLDKSRLLLSSGSPAPQMGKEEDFRRFLDAARAELRRKQGR